VGALDGRVVVVTGAGRGIGRAHASYLAAEGARVVVNDLGAAVTGDGTDASLADAVVDEIRDAGGTAVANHADVSDWESARALIEFAVQTYGDLDVLVNNAGIIRDRPIWDLTEDELDSVLRINLKGHVAPTRWAARYWKERAARDGARDASLVHTSSPSVMGYAGQSNYGAAKGGIATFALVVAEELAPYGVRSNAIVPAARTRMADEFRAWDPERPTPRTLLPTDPYCVRRVEPRQLVAVGRVPRVGAVPAQRAGAVGRTRHGRAPGRLVAWRLRPPRPRVDRRRPRDGASKPVPRRTSGAANPRITIRLTATLFGRSCPLWGHRSTKQTCYAAAGVSVMSASRSRWRCSAALPTRSVCRSFSSSGPNVSSMYSRERGNVPTEWGKSLPHQNSSSGMSSGSSAPTRTASGSRTMPYKPCAFM
jgi:NAD(P)-dependent dehydrogenase (short-subunit alcohol dehydrogenase family)